MAADQWTGRLVVTFEANWRKREKYRVSWSGKKKRRVQRLQLKNNLLSLAPSRSSGIVWCPVPHRVNRERIFANEPTNRVAGVFRFVWKPRTLVLLLFARKSFRFTITHSRLYLSTSNTPFIVVDLLLCLSFPRRPSFFFFWLSSSFVVKYPGIIVLFFGIIINNNYRKKPTNPPPKVVNLHGPSASSSRSCSLISPREFSNLLANARLASCPS